MKRKVLGLLLVAFFMALYIVPTNPSLYSIPSTIPTEQNLLSDDTMIGDTVLTEFGKRVYLGSNQWSYFTQMGLSNTWNGTHWVRWIYNQAAKSVQIRNVTITHNKGGTITIEGESGIKIGYMKWYSQYYFNDEWQNVTLDNYQWIGFSVYPTYAVTKQRFWGSSGELNVSYIYRNNQEFKVTVDVTNNAVQDVPVRIIWAAHDLQNVAGNYEIITEEVFGKNVTVGIMVEDLRISWLDARTSDPNIAINTILDKPNRRAVVVFGNQSSVLPAGHTYTLDPSVNPVLGADSDDDYYKDGSHETGAVIWYHGHYAVVGQVRSQWRFPLAIASGSTIDSANLSLYIFEVYEENPQVVYVRRIDEANVGDLEADGAMPDVVEANKVTFENNGQSTEYETINVTDMVQDQTDLGGWASGQYIGFGLNNTAQVNGAYVRFYDYSHADTNHCYMNVTYTIGGGNNIPSNDGATLTNADDADNLYAVYKEYVFTSNVSDADGFADIDYVEMSLYSGSAYWTIRYDEDIDTFSEELGGSYIVLGGSSAAVEAGNDIDITWYIEIQWAHGDLTNYDLRLYTVDDEPESDTDDYDLNYDVETRVDITTGPTVDDGSGTADRGDYDTISGIAVNGTIDYYGSAISPASGDVDVWVICADVAGSPWSDATLTNGAFSLSVDSDDAVGLDTYTFKVVEEAAGSGGNDLCFSSESDTYIADRMVVTITADGDTVVNGTQVNFTVSVIYDYDDAVFSWWNISVTNDGAPFGVFNHTSTNFNDTDESTTNVYATDAFNNETTHIITKFASVSESVIWYPEGFPPTTNATGEINYFEEVFLSTEIWGYLGPLALVIIGYVLAKKDRGLGVIAFMVQCLIAAQYFTLVEATPDYWWHIFILLFGGMFACVIPLIDR